MAIVLPPRVVVVHRVTEVDELINRHGTRGQVEFFLRSRGRKLDELQDRHNAVTEAIAHVSTAIPTDWRRGTVERADLSRFLFDPHDIVVVVGQDGLVANVAKYLGAQLVVGIDPEPGRNPGVLVQHRTEDATRLLRLAASVHAEVDERTLVRARLDDGQQLCALNEIFVGHHSHQSARYLLTDGSADPERQSSSGVLVSTGTGATGWWASIAEERQTRVPRPNPQESQLAWFVREPWPSPTTTTEHTEGLLNGADMLRVLVESETLVVFGDGLEDDRLTVTWGQEISIGAAPQRLHLLARTG